MSIQNIPVLFLGEISKLFVSVSLLSGAVKTRSLSLYNIEIFFVIKHIKHYQSLGEFGRRQIDNIFFLFFFPENKIRHFMLTVSIGDNLLEMSYPVSWEKIRNIFQIVAC